MLRTAATYRLEGPRPLASSPCVLPVASCPTSRSGWGR